MNIERPDLSRVDPAVRDYIETLEAELDQLRQDERRPRQNVTPITLPPLVPNELPTTFNVITISADGVAKRTPRHLYERQHRGGMGIFDLEIPAEDAPTFLTVADESQGVIVVTNQARAFRVPVSQLPASPVRSRGQRLFSADTLRAGERLALVFPDQGRGYVILVSQRGQLRRLRHHYFGPNLRPGTLLYDPTELGPPAAACWTSGEDEIFIVSREGRAIRFAERLVPAHGCLGLRLDRGDTAVAVAAVGPDSAVFMVSADGKGSKRLMNGFSPNKAPGASGKVAMKTDHLIGAVTVNETDDLFIISRLSKIIRFQAFEIPAKEGVVQGVSCMTLRADETTALTSSLVLSQD